MADQDLNIHIKATDETGGVFQGLTAGVNTMGSAFMTAGHSFRMIGREVGQIGSVMMMAGAAITAPMLLAFNTASKYSADINQTVMDMKDSWDKLSISIGTSMLPVMQQLSQAISAAVDKWNSLNQATREHLVQTALAAGGYLLWGGIALKAIGSVIRVFSDLFLLVGRMITGIGSLVAGFRTLILVNPDLLAIYAIITMIVAAMLKWKDFGDAVCNTIQKIGDIFAMAGQMILGFINEIVGSIATFIASALSALGTVLSVIPGIGQKLKDAFNAGSQAAQSFADGASANLKGLTDDFTAEFKDLTSFNQGNSSMANYFDATKLTISSVGQAAQAASNQVQQLVKSLQGGGFGAGGSSGATQTDNWINGIKLGLQSLEPEVNQWSKDWANMATGMAKNMQTSLGTFFDDVFTGQLTKASQLFANFGNALIKTFADAIAQMITQWIIFGSITRGAAGTSMGGIMGMFGAKFHEGGVVAGVGGFSPSLSPLPTFHTGGPVGSSWDNPVYAHDGLAVDEVPAVLQTGEGVLSRDGMQNLASLNSGKGKGGGSGTTVNPTLVVQSWDASDVMRNMTAIKNAFANDLMNNGQLRTLMRQYT